MELYILHSIEPKGRLAITHVSGNDGVLVVGKASIRQWLKHKLGSELQQQGCYVPPVPVPRTGENL